jgi:hypothetical protein
MPDLEINTKISKVIPEQGDSAVDVSLHLRFVLAAFFALLQRLIETKAMLNERNKDERQRREAKQQAKEQARLQKQ